MSDSDYEKEEEKQPSRFSRIKELKRKSNKIATKIIHKTFSGKEEFDDHETKLEVSPSPPREQESPSHLDLTIQSQRTDESMTQKCADEVEDRHNEIIDLFKGVSMEQVLNMKKKEDIIRQNKFEENMLKMEAEQQHLGRSVDKFQVLNDFRMKNKMGRTSLHICCLDQNPRILKLSIQNIKEHCKTKYEQTKLMKEILNMEDKYENTPLQLACIYSSELKTEDKRQTISMLLQNGADPNIFNKSTGFSSLHWCSRYGETENVRMLLKHGAKDYIPDRRGHIPIDYAGKFRHDQCVQRMLESGLENLRGFTKASQSPKAAKNQQALVYSDAFKESRLYHTSLLYWASTLCDHSFPLDKFKTMLMTLRAYPEGPVKMANFCTPLHAASIHGRSEKLVLLLNDIQTRHENVRTMISMGRLKSISEVDKVYYKKLDLQHLATMKTLLGLKKYKKPKKFHKQFLGRLEDYKTILMQNKKIQNKKMFSYDLLDTNGQTPLYFACLNNQAECAKILIYGYGCSLDISSKNGVKPRDISQIKEILVDFHDKVDKHISQKVEQEESKEFSIDQMETRDEENLLKDSRKKADEASIREVCHQNLLQYYKDRHNSEDTKLIEQTLTARDQLPQVSYLALKIRIDEMHKNRLNYIIANFIQSHFEVKMFHAVEDPAKVFYILLDLNLERLEDAAEQMQYTVKLAEKSLKFKYLKAFKSRYEPFRTKDKQEIMFQILKKQVSMDLLKSKGILLQYFFVHDMNAIYDVQQKFQGTSLFQSLKQCYYESQYNEYRQLTAIKNYFGERIGFEQAFMNFYTSYLIVPAIFGLTVVILNGQAETNVTLLSFAYAAVISIWISVFNERWKRKTNELRINWGTLVQAGSVNQEQIRNEFDGNEEFSHENYNVNRSDILKVGNLFTVLNIVISILFIGTCITIFLLLKNIESDNKYFIQYEGVVNGIIISAINYVYQLIAGPLVDLENHKYESTYIKSFTYKIFIFKFFNTNISLAYTIYMSNERRQTTSSLDKVLELTLEREAIDKLYTLLLGMMLTKVASTFASKCVYRIALFKLKKLWYFRTVKKLGIEQKRQHQTCGQFNYMARKQTFATNANHDNFINQQIDQYEYKRLVTVFNQIPSRDSKRPNSKSCILRDQQLIDQVELNSRMKILSMTWELGDQSEAFIFLSFCTLYSALCPIVSLLVFFHNFFASKWQRHVNLNYVQRNGVIQQNGLGPWTTVLEFLAYATVLSNCVFLYMFRAQFARVVATQTFKFYGTFRNEDHAIEIVDKLQNFVGDEANNYATLLDEQVYSKTMNEIKTHLQKVYNEEVIVQFIIMIIVLEHIILIFKTLLLSFLGDKPHWVTKHEVKVQYEIEQLNVEEKKLEQARMIQELEKTLDEQGISFKKVIEKVTSNYKKISTNSKKMAIQMKEELKIQDELRDQLRKSQAELMTAGERGSQKRKREDMELQNLKLTVEQLTEDLDIAKNEQPALTKFIDNRFNLQLSNGPYAQEIESSIHEHLQIRLFRETYNIIEAQILQRRLQKMSQSEKFVMVSCSECTTRFAEYECPECGNDCFCKICFNELHPHQVKHKPFSIQPDQGELGDILNQKSKSNFMKVGLKKFNEVHIDQPQQSHWIKFEQFNYPLPESNDLFMQLRHYFQYFKESYVKFNGISDLDKRIDLAKLLLDKNYAIVGDKLREVIVTELNTERLRGGRQKKKDELRIVDQGKAELSEKEKSLLERQPATLRGEKMFNEEELLFLNRVGFYVLCKDGAAASFKDFIESLTVLQDGTFEQKLNMLIDFCKQGRVNYQKYIEIETFITMIMSSMPQDQKLRANASYLLQITIKDSYEDEGIELNGSRNVNLNDTLDSQTSLTQSFTRRNTHIEEDELRSIILSNLKVKEIIECVLQIK